MTGNEYREALIVLGLTQTGFGAWVGVHPVTAKMWARRGPPGAVARWVEFLLANQKRSITQKQLDEWKRAPGLDNAVARQLIGEVERLRSAMGGDPTDKGYHGPFLGAKVPAPPQQAA
jgi:hypothetical protein